MGYRLNHLDEPVSMAVSKSLLTEFGIQLRLESCAHGHNADGVMSRRNKKTVFSNKALEKVNH